MSMAANAVKTGLFTLFVPLVVGVAIPQAILAKDHVAISGIVVVRLSGGSLFVLGLLGYFWCGALFVRAGGTPAPIFPTARPVVSGPYRINRNPMYTSVLAAVFGQATIYECWTLAAYGAVLAIAFHFFVVSYEERALRSQFDGEYEDFCQRVPRWIPHLAIFGRRSR